MPKREVDQGWINLCKYHIKASQDGLVYWNHHLAEALMPWTKGTVLQRVNRTPIVPGHTDDARIRVDSAILGPNGECWIVGTQLDEDGNEREYRYKGHGIIRDPQGWQEVTDA